MICSSAGHPLGWAKTLLWLMTGMSLASSAAVAHPHIFVTEEAMVIFESGMLTALRLVWSFDEMYSTATLQELDTNNDGVYSDAELKALAQQTVDELKDLDYYTWAKLGERKLKFAAPVDYGFERRDDVMVFRLTLPLEQPTSIDGKIFSFATRDPDFMSAFSLEKDHPLKIKGSSAECTISPTLTDTDSAEIARLGELFPLGGPGFGLSLTAAGSIRCLSP